MAILQQIPQNAALTLKGAAQEWKEQAGSLRGNQQALARSLAVGSLIAGAVLFARGKRKAGLAAAAAGAAVSLLENPREASAVWENIPGYIQQGKQLLGRMEEFVEDLSGQGVRLKSLLEKIGQR